MAVTSNRKITITWTADVEYSQEFDATVNSAGSGQNQLVALVSGNNTITVPTGATGVTIIPAEDNAVALTLKGVNGDTGIALALTSPTSIGLASVSSFVINAGGSVTVRLIYS